jgi:hypothetical protein
LKIENKIVNLHKGLSNKTFALTKKILRGCYRTNRMKRFRKLLIKHLENNLLQITRWGEALLCSSDIIESIFGRYKNLFRYKNAAPPFGHPYQ